MVCSRRAPGSHITVGIQWHHETGVSLLPHIGHWTRGLPSKCCIMHWPNIPSLYASHRHWASASSVFDRLLIPLQEWRQPTTIFHWVPLGNRRGKKGDRNIHQLFLIGYSSKLAPRQADPVSCLGYLSCLPARACSLAHQVQQGEGLNSRGASTPGGRYQVGGVVWTGETEGAALDFGQNSRIVLRGQQRGTAVGTLFSLTARVGFVFLLLLFHFNAHCQHLDEVGWWRGIWLSCWRCTGGRQDKQNRTKKSVRMTNVNMEPQITTTSQHKMVCIYSKCIKELLAQSDKESFTSHCIVHSE